MISCTELQHTFYYPRVDDYTAVPEFIYCQCRKARIKCASLEWVEKKEEMVINENRP